LRAGKRPQVVVFYDGINDVASLIQNGVPGIPQNEFSRERDFVLGRRVFAWEQDLGTEVRALGALGTAAVQRLQFLARLSRLLRGVTQTGQSPEDRELARSYVDSYLSTVAIVDALGEAYGFVPIHVWQPTIHSTGKSLTAWESAILSEATSNDYGRRLVSVHRLVKRELETRARSLIVDCRLLMLTEAFDAETGPIFADRIGHTYERANTIVVERLLPRVLDAMQRGRSGAECVPD
jgi:hypothetical protein